ncbi:MAG TPA: vitamin K epoxide reductase family protein [Gemmatimonadaceae bacterium]|nr:vitamin K epoxide reductase family protein [Gemmatimonadaceae bacterium]
MTIAVLSLVGILIALYLTLYKLGVIGDLSCTLGSCETVNTSKWATFLGLPVAAWGLAAYVALFALSTAGTADRYAGSQTISVLLVAISAWSVLFSAWLTYLELFVIHAICIWCVTSAVILVAILVVSVADLKSAKSAKSAELLPP